MGKACFYLSIHCTGPGSILYTMVLVAKNWIDLNVTRYSNRKCKMKCNMTMGLGEAETDSSNTCKCSLYSHTAFCYKRAETH